MAPDLPLPPLELRELVGLTDISGYNNPSGQPIFGGFPIEQWDTYLDFGCGCGRSARRLIQQAPRPRRYVGIDAHKGMVRWCNENLAPAAPGFTFIHHDVFQPGLNPNPLRPWVEPLPLESGTATLIEATSVFTHLIEGQAEYYLDEIARVLAPHGHLLATFFLFDKDAFPYMQDNQNALYINDRDPTNAVAFDRRWLERGLAARGLAIAWAHPPAVRGFHWQLDIARLAAGAVPCELPADTAPIGRRPPPQLRAGADKFGLDGVAFSDAPTAAPRQPPPPINPLAVELSNAKEYIASLEAHRARMEEYIASLEAERRQRS